MPKKIKNTKRNLFSLSFLFFLARNRFGLLNHDPLFIWLPASHTYYYSLEIVRGTALKRKKKKKKKVKKSQSPLVVSIDFCLPYSSFRPSPLCVALPLPSTQLFYYLSFIHNCWSVSFLVDLGSFCINTHNSHIHAHKYSKRKHTTGLVGFS